MTLFGLTYSPSSKSALSTAARKVMKELNRVQSSSEEKRASEMNFPKRTQEIAMILCHNQLLDGDTELSRKIVSFLKEAETEWQRAWHIHRLRLWHGSSCTRRRFPEYHESIIKWRSDFRVDEVVKDVHDADDLRKSHPQRNLIQQLKDINYVILYWNLLGWPGRPQTIARIARGWHRRPWRRLRVFQ